MQRIERIEKEKILDILIDITSGNYAEELCQSCPMHKVHNPFCNNPDATCYQAFIYYLTEPMPEET